MKILDMSAGNRAIWIDKNNPLVTFLDRRPEVNPTFVCDTKTLQKHLRLADSVFFLAGRIKFLKPDFTEGHNAGAGSMLLSYGWTPDYKGLKGWKAK